MGRNAANAPLQAGEQSNRENEMMTETHTPSLQFHVDPIEDARGFATIRHHDGTENGDTERQPIATVYDWDYAHEMVKRVNCHEQLLAAIDRCQYFLDGPWTAPEDVIEQVRSAISKATGR